MSFALHALAVGRFVFARPALADEYEEATTVAVTTTDATTSDSAATTTEATTEGTFAEPTATATEGVTREPTCEERR